MKAALVFFIALMFPAASYAAEVAFSPQTLSINGVALGDGFDKAKKLGQADVFLDGDAMGAANKLCLSFDKGGRIIFESGDETGGGAIDNIRIEEASFSPSYLDPLERLGDEKKCGKTHLSSADIVLPFGLKMGMDYAKVIGILGTPETQSQGGKVKLVQFAQHKAMLAAPDKWDAAKCGPAELYDGLNAYLDENDRMIGLTLWHGGPYC